MKIYLSNESSAFSWCFLLRIQGLPKLSYVKDFLRNIFTCKRFTCLHDLSALALSFLWEGLKYFFAFTISNVNWPLFNRFTKRLLVNCTTGKKKSYSFLDFKMNIFWLKLTCLWMLGGCVHKSKTPQQWSFSCTFQIENIWNGSLVEITKAWYTERVSGI